MPTATITSTASIGGLSIQSITTRTASLQIGMEVTMEAAKTGTLSTRTSDTAGTLTMTAGHGFTDGQILAIFWDGGRCYNATIGTVATNSVPFTLAVGDVLPAQTTAITADVQDIQNIDVDGDDLQAIIVMSNRHGHVHFAENDDTVLAAAELTASEPWQWLADQGIANPLTGDPVGQVMLANGDSSNAATFKLGALYDG